jgi:leader peptidase (prepilin peptidase)/N-methyltransferase
MSSLYSALGYIFFAARISKSDLKLRIIRNRDLSFFAIFSLIANLQSLRIELLREMSLVTLTLGILTLFFRRRIGAGDLKLFWVLSLWTADFTFWFQYFSLAWVLGGLFSVASAVFLRRVKGNIPFAPFIFVAFFASVLR